MHALLAALMLAPLASTAQTVIYRCVAADGAVTLQNDARCPKGTREQKRVMPIPAPATTPVAPAAPAAPLVEVPPAAPATRARAARSAATVGADRPGATTTGDGPVALAPVPPPRAAPPLYVCLTTGAERYYSASAESSRCAPVATVGLDGRPSGAQACEVVQDRCAPVPEAERCAAWAEWRRSAEQASAFRPDEAETARADLARVDAAIANSVCAR
ncbi:MAG TPA: DUF4124 domain-containing protein [Lysobacter sp.]